MSFKDDVNKMACEKLELYLRRGLARLTYGLDKEETRREKQRIAGKLALSHFTVGNDLCVRRAAASRLDEIRMVSEDEFTAACNQLFHQLGAELTAEG